MKRRDLIKQIEEMGCIFVRHGSKHDWYQNPQILENGGHLPTFP